VTTVLAGALLTEPGWLAARVERLARSGGGDRRVAGTLWWYSASLVLLGPPVHALLVEGAGLDLSPSAVRFTVRPSDYLENALPGSLLGPGPEAFGAHLDAALGAVITPLAEVSGATGQSLWAIAADSLATRVLASASVTPAGPAAAPALATAIASSSRCLRPVPSYVEVSADTPAVHPRTAVQGLDVHRDPAVPHAPRLYPVRGSCCLLWRVPAGKCITCPAQLPEERAARLLRHARSQG
jgi:ferric iron reductase protein FhuF